MTISDDECHKHIHLANESVLRWQGKLLLEMSFYVETMYHGWRLDHFIGARLRRLSRTRIQTMLRRQPSLGGELYKAARRVQAGESYALRRLAPDEGDIPLHFDVEYEDDYLLIICKPAGLPVHETARFRTKTLRGLLAKQSSHWRMAHRLDRETSGLIIVCKDLATERSIKQLFVNRLVKKQYLAIVRGQVTTPLSLKQPIGPDLDSDINLKQRVYSLNEVKLDDTVALSATTYIEPLAVKNNYSLVSVKPASGRQHQIRVHLSYAGFPIVGDKLYGDDPTLLLKYIHGGMTDSLRQVLLMDRHALHAAALCFRHPVTDEVISIHSDIPADMKQFFFSESIT